MSTVTISKKEYRELTEKKLRLEYLKYLLEGDIFSLPPTRSKKEIVSALGATRRYSKKFLASLRKGLGRSAYFNKP